MKAATSLLFVLSMIAGSVQGAPAKDLGSTAADSTKIASGYPGGGWDLNDARLSVVRSKLLTNGTSKRYPEGDGGWDGNDARVSVVRTSLLSNATVSRYRLGGGWDANDARVSVVRTGGLLSH